ncbi:MAG: DUF1566 domain-containing protein, partial [Sulfurovum sp.]
DFETKSSYTFIASATDGTNTANQTISVTITNIAEVTPILNDKNNTRDITSFTYSGDADWSNDVGTLYSSGGIDDNQSSCITSTTEVGGVLSFDWNVSSELNSDFLSFYIDNASQDSISGDTIMANKSYEVEKGSVVKWCYTKNFDTFSGLDKGWIRDVKMLREYYNIDENASTGSSVGFVNIQIQSDANISSFTLNGVGNGNFEVTSSGEILVQSQLDYETQKFYYLTTIATNQSGDSNSVDINISINNDNNDLYIKSAIYDDNSTTITSDDRLSIYFTKDVDSGTLSFNSFNIYGNGVIDGGAEYNNSIFKYDISFNSSAERVNDTNLSITNSVDAVDSYTLYYETLTKVNSINKFSRLKTGDTNDTISNSDGDLKRGLTPSYTDNVDGTITDNNIALIWQKEDDNSPKTLSVAQTYCADLTIASYSNWQLPSVEELFSILDKGSDFGPHINSLFTNTNDDGYWSSSSFVGDSTKSWYIGFDNLFVGFTDIANDKFVRCVHRK